MTPGPPTAQPGAPPATTESIAAEPSSAEPQVAEPPMAASRDDLETFTGAEAHSSESAHPNVTDAVPSSGDAASSDPGSNPDTQ